MSPKLRDALLVLGLLFVLVLVVQRAAGGSSSSAAEQPTRMEPFPERVVARAAPLPQFADGGWTRVQQRVASLDGMWEQVFADSGGRDERPRLVERGGEEGCGAPTSGWAGLYCPATRTLVVDLDSHAQRHQAAGQGVSDLVLGYIVAHEVGHHVQTLRGAPDRSSSGDARKRELHAECLAGVWGRAAGLALPPTWVYTPDAVHGTVEEQIRWLNEGHRHGRPADCDAVWADGAVA